MGTLWAHTDAIGCIVLSSAKQRNGVQFIWYPSYSLLCSAHKILISRTAQLYLSKTEQVHCRTKYMYQFPYAVFVWVDYLDFRYCASLCRRRCNSGSFGV